MFLFATLSLAALSLVFGEDPPTLENTVTGIFIQTDTNKDGVIQRSELDSEVFRVYDANHDEQVTLSEVLHVFGTAQEQAGRNIFHSLDINRDGHWDHIDLVAIYSQMDTDGDHRVTQAEFTAWLTAILVKSGFTFPTVG